MNKNIKRIKLYVKDTPKAFEIKKIVYDELLKHGFEINNDVFDLVISIGGDGTFLKMIHDNNFNNDIYYASINAGSLGFLSSSTSSQIEKFINDLANMSFNIRNIDPLYATVYFKDKTISLTCVNEFMIRKNNFSTLHLDILINNLLLDKYVGEGLIISTPIGSTGYNLSFSGPIVDNDLKVISLTPIAPINNKVYKSFINPMIISNEKNITIIPHDNISLLCDGKIVNFEDVEKIELKLSENVIKCIVPIDYDYFNNIKNKIIDLEE